MAHTNARAAGLLCIGFFASFFVPVLVMGSGERFRRGLSIRCGQLLRPEIEG
jgi:hypothetical protein